MAVRLSASSAGRAILPRNCSLFLVLISVRCWVNPKGLVRLGGLGNFEAIQWPRRTQSNPRPSGLHHTASTTPRRTQSNPRPSGLHCTASTTILPRALKMDTPIINIGVIWLCFDTLFKAFYVDFNNHRNFSYLVTFPCRKYERIRDVWCH
jgi:hypothetical protein